MQIRGGSHSKVCAGFTATSARGQMGCSYQWLSFRHTQKGEMEERIFFFNSFIDFVFSKMVHPSHKITMSR